RAAGGVLSIGRGGVTATADAGPRRAGAGDVLVVRAVRRSGRAMEVPVHREVRIEEALTVGRRRVEPAATDARHQSEGGGRVAAVDVGPGIADAGVGARIQ